MTREDELLEIDKLLAEKPAKAKRTAANTTVKKAKKITKKEQQILDVTDSIVMPDNYHLINTVELMDKLIQHYQTYKTMYVRPYIYLDTETYGLNNFKDEIISISIGFDSQQYFNIPLRPFLHERSKDIPTLGKKFVEEILRPILQNSKWLILANAKFDIHVLYNWSQIDITYNIFWDTMIAGGLLNENHPKGLKEWYKTYAMPDLIRKGKMADESDRPTFKFGSMFDKIPFDSIPETLATYYACHDVFMTRAVFQYQYEVFNDPKYMLDTVYKLFRFVEMPLIAVLATAERRGVVLDVPFLQGEVGEALKKKEKELKEGIFSHLGATIQLTKNKTRQKNGIKYKEEHVVVEELNLNSPKQLAARLYDDLKILQPVKEYDKELKKEVYKNKTDRKTLEKNKKTHPVIPLILEFRGVTKLISSFTESLPETIDGNLDGKVHPSYNQLVKTGRMSCSQPNLQQVPSKFDVIRMAFRADEGRLLASIDFSQQELRWLAIFTQDPALLEVYQKGLDMHSRITCQVKGYNYEIFEHIRNHVQETAEETQAVIAEILQRYQGSPEIAHMMRDANVQAFDATGVATLADFFELSRKKMKSVVFGTVYGISEMGLSDQLNISKEEAKSLIDGFKAGLPNYLSWEANIHKQVKDKMYVEDILGRKRRFAEDILKARDTPEFKQRGWHWLISKCMRQGGNYRIQGSSASQVKQALVNLHYPLREDGTRCLDRTEWLAKGYQSVLEKHDSFVSLQIHDEIVFNVPNTISHAALRELASTMENAVDVSWSGIGFRSDIEIAPYWAGKYSMEELEQINNGDLDWMEQMMLEAKKKIARNLGDEYAIGLFADVLKADDEDDDEEDAA